VPSPRPAAVRTRLSPELAASTAGAASLGLVLPTYPQRSDKLPTRGALATAARRAEDAGAAAVWACDHLFWHGPATECLSAVTVAALSTTRVTVGPCVLQLPLRDSSSVAKQAASLSDISGGRLVLGVGMGAHRGEYEACGVDFDRRGERLDRAVLAIRRAWSADGEGPYRQLPAPGRIPVWIGGSSEAALRRSAVSGDGWIPLFLTPAEYGAALERLDKEAERAGRDPSLITRAIVVFVAVGGSEVRERGLDWMSSLYAIAPGAFERHLVSGEARTVARSVAGYLEEGAQHVAVFIADDEPSSAFEDLCCELPMAEALEP